MRLCAALALAGSGVAQNMGQWVGGEHCAGSHCGPGKEEKRCDNPAGAGAHVLYNASVAVGDKTEHLTTRWVHAVVDDSTQGKAMDGVCVGDAVADRRARDRVYR